MGSDYSAPQKLTDASVQEAWSDTRKAVSIIRYVVEKHYTHEELDWKRWQGDKEFFFRCPVNEIDLVYGQAGFMLPDAIRVATDRRALTTEYLKTKQLSVVKRLVKLHYPVDPQILFECASDELLTLYEDLDPENQAEMRLETGFISAWQGDERVSSLFKWGFAYEKNELKELNWKAFYDFMPPLDLLDLITTRQDHLIFLEGCIFRLTVERYALKPLAGWLYPFDNLMNDLICLTNGADILDQFLSTVPHEFDQERFLHVDYFVWNPDPSLFRVIDKYHPLKADPAAIKALLRRREVDTVLTLIQEGWTYNRTEVLKALADEGHLPGYLTVFKMQNPPETHLRPRFDLGKALQYPKALPEIMKLFPDSISAQDVAFYCVNNRWTPEQVDLLQTQYPEWNLQSRTINEWLRKGHWKYASHAIEEDWSYDPDFLHEKMMESLTDDDVRRGMLNHPFPVDSRFVIAVYNCRKSYTLVEDTDTPPYRGYDTEDC